MSWTPGSSDLRERKYYAQYCRDFTHTYTHTLILIKPKQWVIESIDRSTVRGATTRFVQLIRRSRNQLICRDYCLIYRDYCLNSNHDILIEKWEYIIRWADSSANGLFI
eukprot:sb/3477420/